MVFRAFTFLVLGWCVLGLRGQEAASQDRTLHIPRVERQPKLSDFIDGVPREAELVITDFRQYVPGEGAPATAPTTAYLSYDDVNLYFGFLCEDDRKVIRARVSKCEQIFRDDRISICIDTFHDHRHMYWFDVNPYGIQADGNVTDGVEDDASWDTLWYSEGKFTDKGYAVFVTIPFKSFRFPSKKEQTWGLIIGRWIMRNNEYSVWPYVSRRLPGFVQQGGDLEGFHDISPGRNIQLIPYGLFSRSRYLDLTPGGPPEFRRDRETRVGLDAKLVLKDAFTLDIALNPDFSQVESDEPQVTINQRYEVFFPEKRPFFMENGGYFKTPEQLFFSRRIRDPRLGARFTGKAGPWSLGALVVDDRAPGAQVGRNDPLRGEQALAGVVRLQREFRKNSNAAVMVTSQDFGPAHNRVFALDTRLQLLRNSQSEAAQGNHGAVRTIERCWRLRRGANMSRRHAMMRGVRTTVYLPDDLLAESKRYASDTNRILTRLIEDCLRESLARRDQASDKPRVSLPTFGGGRLLPGVDLDDSAALLDLIERPEWRRKSRWPFGFSEQVGAGFLRVVINPRVF